MDFEKYLKELESDKEIIYSLQDKYLNLLKEHMKKKGNERDASWNKTRSMLFHISGAASMLGNGVRTWIEIRKNYGL